MSASDNQNESEKLDLFAVCREILTMLLDGKNPDDVNSALIKIGVNESDRPQLINITVASAQAASPVIEQKITREAAVQSLIEQGMENGMAESMIAMILDTMTARAEQQVGNDHPPELAENTAKILMRLGAAVLTDLQNGGDETAMAEAIHNIEGIAEITEIYNREPEFIANVKLAAEAAQRAQALPLPDVIKQLGLDKTPYAGVLALFFMRLKREANNG